MRGEDDEEELRAKRCRAGRGLSARPPPPPTAYLQLLPNTVFSFSLSHSHSLTVKSLRSSQGFTLKPYALKPFFFSNTLNNPYSRGLELESSRLKLKAQAQGSTSQSSSSSSSSSNHHTQSKSQITNHKSKNQNPIQNCHSAEIVPYITTYHLLFSDSFLPLSFFLDDVYLCSILSITFFPFLIVTFSG